MSNFRAAVNDDSSFSICQGTIYPIVAHQMSRYDVAKTVNRTSCIIKSGMFQPSQDPSPTCMLPEWYPFIHPEDKAHFYGNPGLSLPIIEQKKTVMAAIPTIILFAAQWILVIFFVVFIFQAFIDRDAVAKTEDGTALVKRKSKRGKKAKEKTASLLVVDCEKRLGYGSHGTAVYEGLFQGRPVAAALDLCLASLADIFGDLRGSSREEEWDTIAKTLDAKRAMKQIASVLMDLHGLGLVHQDINPQNILISSAPSRRILISYSGLCKKLDEDQSSFLPATNGASAAGSVGWQAPEILRRHVKLNELSVGDDSISSRQGPTTTTTGSSSGTTTPTTKIHLTKSIDIFSLGCVFYYILTKGKHPYGDHIHREANIIKGNKDLSPIRYDEEALDLITRMLDPDPSQRPAIETCLVHPFFWTPTKRLNFLQEVSDRLERMCKDKDAVLIRLERDAKRVFQHDWRQYLYPRFVEGLRKTRTYDGDSVRDLMRALRNKKNHYEDLPDDVKLELGPIPEGYLGYFASRFPKLLMYVHEVIRDTELHTEPGFRRFFELSET